MYIFVIEGLFENTARAQRVRYFLKSAEITNIYMHSRVRYDLYHMSLDLTNMGSIDRPNFDLLKGFL